MRMPLRLIVYPIFGFFCLFLFTFILFPFDSLKGRIEGEAERLLGSRYAVTIGKISPTVTAGLSLKKIEVQRIGTESKFELDRIRLRMSLLPLLWGDRYLSMKLKAGDGNLKGTFEMGKEETKIDLEFAEMDLKWSRLALAQVPFAGKANGKMHLDLFPADPLRNAGLIEVQISDLQIEQETLLQGFPIPAMALQKGTSQLKIGVERGNWVIETLKLEGGDVQLTLDGKVYAARQVDNYRLNLRGDFLPMESSREKLSFLTLLESQKGPDGKYPFTITGRLSNPSIRIGSFKIPI